MEPVFFSGQMYLDDRMYVNSVWPCVVEQAGDEEKTTIYYGDPPPDHQHCVVTYRNIRTYPITGCSVYSSFEEAAWCAQNLCRDTPMVSCGGKAVEPRPSWEEHLALCNSNGWEEFDPSQVFLPGGINRREILIKKRQ